MDPTPVTDRPPRIEDATPVEGELRGPGGVRIKTRIRAAGHKSSEGDGRTAADIRRELGLPPKPQEG